MPRLTIYCYDVDTGKGIRGVHVYLFAGGGGIEPPELADYLGVTDALGNAVFDVYETFFRVGIGDRGYEAADPHQAPLEEWRDTYCGWGACGVYEETTYEFPLRILVLPPPPIETPILVLGQVSVGLILTLTGLFLR